MGKEKQDTSVRMLRRRQERERRREEVRFQKKQRREIRWLKAHWMLVVGIVVCVVFLFYTGIQHWEQATQEKIKKAMREFYNTAEKAVSAPPLDFDTVENIITEISGDNTKAQFLVEYYKQFAKRSVVDAAGVIYADETFTMKQENFFLVIVPPTQYTGQNQATFIRARRTLSIIDFPSTKLFRGVVILHELQHAYDTLIGQEKSHKSSKSFEANFQDLDFVAGEVSAYTLEYGLLDASVNGMFKNIVRRFIGDGQYVRYHDCPYFRSLEDIRLMDGLFESAYSQHEAGLRMGAYLTILLLEDAGIQFPLKKQEKEKLSYCGRCFLEEYRMLEEGQKL